MDYLLLDEKGFVIGQKIWTSEEPRTVSGKMKVTEPDQSYLPEQLENEHPRDWAERAKRTTLPQVEKEVQIEAECHAFVDKSDYFENEISFGSPLPFPRKRRDELLEASDKWGVADFRASQPQKTVAKWDAYRKALRNLPDVTPSNTSIEWPETPK